MRQAVLTADHSHLVNPITPSSRPGFGMRSRTDSRRARRRPSAALGETATQPGHRGLRGVIHAETRKHAPPLRRRLLLRVRSEPPARHPGPFSPHRTRLGAEAGAARQQNRPDPPRQPERCLAGLRHGLIESRRASAEPGATTWSRGRQAGAQGDSRSLVVCRWGTDPRSPRSPALAPENSAPAAADSGNAVPRRRGGSIAAPFSPPRPAARWIRVEPAYRTTSRSSASSSCGGSLYFGLNFGSSSPIIEE